ncbi:multiple epidermal growth factor-like domains protein 6 [Ptychodera flava]|uniref:multiple epidermal growth factor-like domains protein 6 n=1 Tax=Ptychodera flava TaxID=63121 RepID=UPI003969D812
MRLLDLCFITAATILICKFNFVRSDPTTHVCSRTVLRTLQRAIPRTTSERYKVKCKLFGWWRCTKYRLKYATVYRTSYIQHTDYYCCPGWTNMVSNVCLTPICQRQCLNGGTCVAPDTCECPPGYSDTTCSTDVNECDHDNGGCDQACVNTDGSYYCTCRSGFTLTLDGHHCDDGINECLLANGGCQQNCHNTVGSFYCSCYDGYNLEGDGTSCEDINECETDNGGCEHECENFDGGFECFCRTGYQLAADDSSCEDINECWNDIDGCNQNCHNTLASYYCTCDDGFLLQSDGLTCQDVDECQLGNGGCEHICVNTEGAYRCQCHVGYVVDFIDAQNCIDIDECIDINHGCNHICTNTVGGYTCSCFENFVLAPDNKTCVVVDQCEGHNCDHTCVSVPGTHTFVIVTQVIPSSLIRYRVLMTTNVRWIMVDVISHVRTPSEVIFAIATMVLHWASMARPALTWTNV